MSSLVSSRIRGASSDEMRFSVDSWEVGYGTAMAMESLHESGARVDPDVEIASDQWGPIAPEGDLSAPSAVLFVDGVRRIDARVWIDDPADPSAHLERAATASMAVCASYAAGVVCCCGTGPRQAHVLETRVRRGLFTTSGNAADIPTSAGTYVARHAAEDIAVPLTVTLTNAIQQALGEIEVAVAAAARFGSPSTAEHAPRSSDRSEDDLLVVDGPLRNQAHLPRTIGLIKSHRAEYLPPALNAVVASLVPGERTPLFLMGTNWERHAWYLRLPIVPNVPGAPWAGVVRCEAAVDVPRARLIALANLSQTVLCRYASVAYKDARAPQNLVPIAGLEHALRHRLGDARVMYRALQEAARK